MTKNVYMIYIYIYIYKYCTCIGGPMYFLSKGEPCLWEGCTRSFRPVDDSREAEWVAFRLASHVALCKVDVQHPRHLFFATRWFQVGKLCQG